MLLFVEIFFEALRAGLADFVEDGVFNFKETEFRNGEEIEAPTGILEAD